MTTEITPTSPITPPPSSPTSPLSLPPREVVKVRRRLPKFVLPSESKKTESSSSSSLPQQRLELTFCNVYYHGFRMYESINDTSNEEMEKQLKKMAMPYWMRYHPMQQMQFDIRSSAIVLTEQQTLRDRAVSLYWSPIAGAAAPFYGIVPDLCEEAMVLLKREEGSQRLTTTLTKRGNNATFGKHCFVVEVKDNRMMGLSCSQVEIMLSKKLEALGYIRHHNLIDEPGVELVVYEIPELMQRSIAHVLAQRVFSKFM